MNVVSILQKIYALDSSKKRRHYYVFFDWEDEEEFGFGAVVYAVKFPKRTFICCGYANNIRRCKAYLVANQLEFLGYSHCAYIQVLVNFETSFHF